jgi:hypothetical protein
MNTHFIIILLGMVMFGCQTIPYEGTARIVKLKPQAEGVIALPLDPRTEDRNLAEQKMTLNCKPGQYEVLEEGEVVIGEKTNSTGSSEHRASSSKKVGSIFGLPIVSGSGPGTETESQQIKSQVKEWQISYKCVGFQNSKPTKVIK